MAASLGSTSTLGRRRSFATLPRSKSIAGPIKSRGILLIDRILPGGCVDRDGRLGVGDRLLFVNDRKLSRANLGEAANALQNAPQGYTMIGVAKMKLVHAPPPMPQPAATGTDEVDAEMTPQYAGVLNNVMDEDLPHQVDS